MSIERWLPVRGYEGIYEVSDQGRVRSFKRRGRILRPARASNGYLTVALSKRNDARSYTVHELVLSAFVSERPKGTDGCHSNGDRADNRLINLRWDTRRGNLLDMRRHLTDRRSLSDGCRQRVRDMAALGVAQRDIGAYFSVSQKTVWRVLHVD